MNDEMRIECMESAVTVIEKNSKSNEVEYPRFHAQITNMAAGGAGAQGVDGQEVRPVLVGPAAHDHIHIRDLCPLRHDVLIPLMQARGDWGGLWV